MLATLSKELVTGPDCTSPFDPPPRVPDAVWVRPRLVAQIAYAEWTADGKLRQPAFLGLRADKRPEQCAWARRE